MTARTKPLPPHGSYARANGSPGYRPRCKCEPCLTTRRREEKRARTNRELGRSPFIDPAAARAHLQHLHQTMSWRSLATATGLPQSGLIRLYNGDRTKIHRSTHTRIMAVHPPTKGDGGQLIDATGSRRRVQALSYIGHSLQTIAEAAGTGRMRIHAIASGSQPTIRRDLTERIEAAYKRLTRQPVSTNKFTQRSRNTARAKGWHGPLAWDTDTIDDPAAQPDVEPVTERKPDQTENALHIAGEIQHLAAFNIPEHEIAKRVGRSRSYVHEQLAGRRGPGWRNQLDTAA
ncbi:hypothetical protein ABZ547_08445 [Streptomyces sparsogenes]|uniref:hypothetical protein n=1 Tax=Streptomyces sparsogenes TaxID=67365 RepID=UPI0033FBEC6F